jgi:hypothetical protein
LPRYGLLRFARNDDATNRRLLPARGVGVARRVPEKAIRAAVVAVGAVLTVIFFLK